MELNRELLFFFSALGAFNGVVLGLYFLFFIKTKHIANRFFGVFLLMLSIRVGKSVFFYFNRDLSFHYLQLGTNRLFFYRPFSVFLYKIDGRREEFHFQDLEVSYCTASAHCTCGWILVPF